MTKQCSRALQDVKEGALIIIVTFLSTSCFLTGEDEPHLVNVYHDNLLDRAVL